MKASIMKKASLYILILLIGAVTAAVWYRVEKVTTTPPMDTIIIGTNTEFPPFSFKSDNGDIVGFDIDIIQEVFKRIDKETIIKDMPFDALIPEIQIGNIHVIAAGMSPTDERAQRTLFTKPHLTGNPLLIISPKEKEPLTTVADLAGKTVVVNEGYVADSFMSEQPAVTLVRLSSALVSDGILALQSGRADAFVAASFSMKPYFEKHDKNAFYITPIPSTEEASAIAISKHYPDLFYLIQSTIDMMIADGTIEAFKKKWNLV